MTELGPVVLKAFCLFKMSDFKLPTIHGASEVQIGICFDVISRSRPVRTTSFNTCIISSQLFSGNKRTDQSSEVRYRPIDALRLARLSPLVIVFLIVDLGVLRLAVTLQCYGLTDQKVKMIVVQRNTRSCW